MRKIFELVIISLLSFLAVITSIIKILVFTHDPFNGGRDFVGLIIDTTNMLLPMGVSYFLLPFGILAFLIRPKTKFQYISLITLNIFIVLFLTINPFIGHVPIEVAGNIIFVLVWVFLLSVFQGRDKT